MTLTIDALYDGRVLTPNTPLGLKPNEYYSISIEDTPHVMAAVPPAVGDDDEGVAAWRIYDSKLKQILEPAYNGKIVAVHLETEDYEVAPRTLGAWKALKARRPDGHIVALEIGPVRENDPLELRRSGILRSEVRAF
jgi:hypothetical protein